MGIAYPIVSSSRLIRVLDVLLLFWILAWLLLAILIGREIRELKRLSSTVVASSDVLHETANVLRALKDLPLVGEQVATAEDAVERAADSARVSGRASRHTIDALSILLGISIALIPTVPLVGLYLPLRISWRREVRAVHNALFEAGSDPMFREFLARRATEKLAYHQLRQIEANPWRAMEEGRFERLSEAELHRLGLRRRDTDDK